METMKTSAGGAGEEEFLSLREILVMILRHRWPVAIFVAALTAAAGAFFFLQPSIYKAEGYLQVIPPVSLEGKVDRELFETRVVSHLQRASSAFIAKDVAAALSATGYQFTPLKLEQKIAITRPPKTDLIRMVVEDKSADTAKLIVRQWIAHYLASFQHNNIRTALPQIRQLLKQSQGDFMELQAVVEKMRSLAALTAPLVTVSRAVDDRQLWNDLTQKATPDADAMKKLAEVHIKGQEQSSEYLGLKASLYQAEQSLASSTAKREFLLQVEQLLERRLATNGADGSTNPPATNAVLSDAETYVKMIIQNVEIVQFGEPGLIVSKRGAWKKTTMVFVGALILACLGAFLCEWGRGLLGSQSSSNARGA